MNDFPNPSVPYSAPPPQRNRRSGRTQGRHAKAKKPPLITWWQALILVALVGVIVYQASQLTQANARLKALYETREQERQRYENTVQAHQPKYRDLIEQYAAEYNLNPAYVSAIIKQESDYNPRAVSNKGAMGLMQFMPNTFDWVAPNCGIKKTDLDAVYEPENAINALLTPQRTNTYLPNGHNFQDNRLRCYLPGNGGLLTAVAMMCAGWDGETRHNPGFPDNGAWDVKWEGLLPLP